MSGAPTFLGGRMDLLSPVGYSHGHIVYSCEDGKFRLWHIKTESLLEKPFDTAEAACEAVSPVDSEPWFDSDNRTIPYQLEEEAAPNFWTKLLKLLGLR